MVASADIAQSDVAAASCRFLDCTAWRLGRHDGQGLTPGPHSLACCTCCSPLVLIHTTCADLPTDPHGLHIVPRLLQLDRLVNRHAAAGSSHSAGGAGGAAAADAGGSRLHLAQVQSPRCCINCRPLLACWTSLTRLSCSCWHSLSQPAGCRMHVGARQIDLLPSVCGLQNTYL